MKNQLLVINLRTTRPSHSLNSLMKRSTIGQRFMIFLFEELNVCYFTFALLFAVGKSDMLIFRFLEKPFHLLKKTFRSHLVCHAWKLWLRWWGTSTSFSCPKAETICPQEIQITERFDATCPLSLLSIKISAPMCCFYFSTLGCCTICTTHLDETHV